MNILEKLPALILMLISLVGFLSAEMIKCDYSRKKATENSGVYQYTAIVSVICAFALWIASGFTTDLSQFTIGMAVSFGVAVMGQISASAFAMKIGPWSYTAVMMSLSTVIPALSGVIFWNEKLGVNKIAGIVLMLICFVLSVKNDDNDAEKKKSNIKWFLLSLTASLCTGGIGILQKAHQTSVYKNEIMGFLVISFVCSAVLSIIMMHIVGGKMQSNKITNKSVGMLLIFAGVGTALNHLINLYLSGAMESAVFFPVMSGGELIFVTITSVLIFKEQLSKKQWTGLVCGILAVVILCL